MKEVRDATIEEFHRYGDGKMKDVDAVRVSEILSSRPSKERILSDLVPYVVDSLLSRFLGSIEENDGRFLYSKDRNSQPEELKVVSDGLTGELFGEGWISKFSDKPHSWLGQ